MLCAFTALPTRLFNHCLQTYFFPPSIDKSAPDRGMLTLTPGLVCDWSFLVTYRTLKNNKKYRIKISKIYKFFLLLASYCGLYIQIYIYKLCIIYIIFGLYIYIYIYIYKCFCNIQYTYTNGLDLYKFVYFPFVYFLFKKYREIR